MWTFLPVKTVDTGFLQAYGHHAPYHGPAQWWVGRALLQEHSFASRNRSGIFEIIDNRIADLGQKRETDVSARFLLIELQCITLPFDMVKRQISDIGGPHPKLGREQDDCIIPLPRRAITVNGTKQYFYLLCRKSRWDLSVGNGRTLGNCKRMIRSQIVVLKQVVEIVFDDL